MDEVKPNPFRSVSKAEFSQSKYARRGHGQIVLTLECGHTVNRKSSIPIPKRARCRYQDCMLEKNDA